MSGRTGLVVSFPASGTGGTTLEQLEKLAARRGLAYLELANPASVGDLDSGGWLTRSADAIQRAAGQASAGYLILAGHCMGGLSATRVAHGLGSRLSLPVRVLVINTPCPDSQARIPTMTRMPDAEIGDLLVRNGFPQDLVDDEDMLAEIAGPLRDDAVVADRLAEWVSAADDLEAMHVLALRGDVFIPPAVSLGWQHRVSREFQLMIADGGHAIDETTAGLLARVLDAAVAAVAAAEQEAGAA